MNEGFFSDLMGWATHPNPEVRAGAFQIFENLIGEHFSKMSPHVGNMLVLIASTFEQPNPYPLYIAAIDLMSTISSMDGDKQTTLVRLQSLVLPILTVCYVSLYYSYCFCRSTLLHFKKQTIQMQARFSFLFKHSVDSVHLYSLLLWIPCLHIFSTRSSHALTQPGALSPHRPNMTSSHSVVLRSNSSLSSCADSLVVFSAIHSMHSRCFRSCRVLSASSRMSLMSGCPALRFVYLSLSPELSLLNTF